MLSDHLLPQERLSQDYHPWDLDRCSLLRPKPTRTLSDTQVKETPFLPSQLTTQVKETPFVAIKTYHPGNRAFSSTIKANWDLLS
jgi:hypothetical protein